MLIPTATGLSVGQIQTKAKLQGVSNEVVDADDIGSVGNFKTKAELQGVVNEVDDDGEASVIQYLTETKLEGIIATSRV